MANAPGKARSVPKKVPTFFCFVLFSIMVLIVRALYLITPIPLFSSHRLELQMGEYKHPMITLLAR